MPFTVNEFQDLLAILRAQPEWKEALRRELLGEELLSLPALVRDLVKVVEEINKRLYRVEQDVAQLKTDVAQLKTDVGSLKGESLERKYRERPFVYFRRILRKPKALTDAEIDDLISPALEQGVLTEDEADEIGRLDVIVRGRRPSDGQMIYLAVEVSAKIDARDVERAVRRAKLLEKIPGVVASPLVAGETLTDEGLNAAKQLSALVVTNGHLNQA